MPEIEEEKTLEEKKENSAEPNQDGDESETKKKRTADRQITKDDGEDDDEDVDAKLNQPFQKASEEVLSKRKILKVKRPANGGSKPASSNPFATTILAASTTKASDSGAKVFGGGSAFSGFGGFGSSKSSTSGGFGSSSGSGFGNAFGGGSSGFGSSSSSSGGFGAKASSNQEDDTTKASTSLFGKPTGSTGFSFGFAKPSSANKDSESSAASAAMTLPENVKLTTGEEDEVKMHEVRCKSFKMVAQVEAEAADERKESANPSVKPSSNFANKNQESSKSSDEKEGDGEKGPQHRWQEVGTGPLKILRSTDHGDRFRMVQRQESSKNGPAHKVILNVPLWKEATCAELSEKQLRLTTPGSGESSTFTLKFKEAGEALAFSECIKDLCAEAKSCFASSD
ncbi:MAG: hypothetical protein SGBAC_005942 [Bacillariaceae sp.]